jgi:hypothetical protein
VSSERQRILPITSHAYLTRHASMSIHTHAHTTVVLKLSAHIYCKLPIFCLSIPTSLSLPLLLYLSISHATLLSLSSISHPSHLLSSPISLGEGVPPKLRSTPKQSQNLNNHPRAPEQSVAQRPWMHHRGAKDATRRMWILRLCGAHSWLL